MGSRPMAQEDVVPAEQAAAAAGNQDIDPPKVEDGAAFSFHHLPEASWPDYDSREMNEHLMKWNLDQNSQMLKFRFDQKFDEFHAEQFVRDFFSDPTIQSHIRVASQHGMVRGPGTPTGVRMTQSSTTATDLEFFDVLRDADAC